ncbi:MAG: hypothetical protein A2Y71_12195 [Bacteroidetes bacterium RBG_13_42_15]|nr:MAG: hypothetical protein A2Y71_12195 [Bacteroidetes bacterium RBG_13_42_15]
MGNCLVVKSLRDLAQGSGRGAEGEKNDTGENVQGGEFCFHNERFKGAAAQGAKAIEPGACGLTINC